MKIIIVLIVLLAGIGISVEAAANTRLRDSVQSPMLGALISFLVGSVILLILTLAGVLGHGKLSGVVGMPWWAWIGGALGAFAVTASIIGLKRIGAGSLVAAIVFGQLAAGLALDSFGWLDVPRIPINAWRIVGAVLLLAGMLLVQKK